MYIYIVFNRSKAAKDLAESIRICGICCEVSPVSQHHSDFSLRRAAVMTFTRQSPERNVCVVRAEFVYCDVTVDLNLVKKADWLVYVSR